MSCWLFGRPRLPSVAGFGSAVRIPSGPGTARCASRYQAFDAGIDPEELQKARAWRQSFSLSVIPKGNTVFSRSSGPGGQHVNKTETKAVTSWTIGELAGVLPRIVQDKLSSCRYYAKKTDSIMIQEQAQRSRSANAEQNRQKLYEELLQIYETTVPGEANAGNAQKYKAIEQSFHQKRIREKKKLSSKKQSRRGGNLDF